jgi:hypothetical protein
VKDYPEKTCEIVRLIRHPKLVAAALAGRKTQQRRDGLYAYPGESFELEGVTFTVTAVERKTLADMDDDDAKAEGYPGLDAYKELILKMHPNMAWDGSHQVWVHHFERSDKE